MPRPRKYRVNRDRSKVTKSGPKTRNLVEYTDDDEESERNDDDESERSDDDESERNDDEESERNDDEESERNDDDESERNDDEESERNNDDENDNETDNEPIDGPKRRKRHNKFRDVNLEQPNKLEPVQLEDKVPSDDDGASTTDEDDVPIEEFTAPDFNDLESDHEYFDTNINFNDSWILLWIFKYQARFRVPDVAIESLIKFFRMELINEIGHVQYVLNATLCIKYQKFCQEIHKMRQIPDSNALMWNFLTILCVIKGGYVEQN
ncbi:unnamed protein product [Rhizophagus irregularis]|nr:unnamed protein product [Rhizophagus irregularis]